MKRKTVLSIAGSDCSGGAGIQADIKTILSNGAYAMSAITAMTAQNTQGVTAILPSTPLFLAQQLDAIFTDIPPDAVKIGMLFSADLIQVVAEKLQQYSAKHIVLDPVMIATSGVRLIQTEAMNALLQLFPLAQVITPNLPEAEALLGHPISSLHEMEQAAQQLSDTYPCAVLLKGGHRTQDANDVLYEKGNRQWFYGKHINNPNTHGTGCTFSSAIATFLAKGDLLPTAIQRAKDYLSGALSANLSLGKGKGPLDHGWLLKNEN